MMLVYDQRWLAGEAAVEPDPTETGKGVAIQHEQFFGARLVGMAESDLISARQNRLH
jgi:hypothetical protein